MAWYLRLGHFPTTWMLAEEEDPDEVGERIAAALAEGVSAPVRWVPTDKLDALTMWVNPAQVPFWVLTEMRHDD